MLVERATFREPCIERIVGNIVVASAGHNEGFVIQTVVLAKFDFCRIGPRRNIERVLALIGTNESPERYKVGDLRMVRFVSTEVSANYSRQG